MQAFEPKGFWFFEHAGVNALPIVSHFQCQDILFVGEVNVHCAGMCVFGDVG